MKHRLVILSVAAAGTFGLGVATEPDISRWSLESGIVAPAEARILRPLTPLSVAGVARRTTRRAIRRSAIYANTLPVGCASVQISGASLYRCGATYYQPYQGRYVVVYVD